MPHGESPRLGCSKSWELGANSRAGKVSSYSHRRHRTASDLGLASLRIISPLSGSAGPRQRAVSSVRPSSVRPLGVTLDVGSRMLGFTLLLILAFFPSRSRVSALWHARVARERARKRSRGSVGPAMPVTPLCRREPLSQYS
jgi:hypothetical protein